MAACGGTLRRALAGSLTAAGLCCSASALAAAAAVGAAGLAADPPAPMIAATPPAETVQGYFRELALGGLGSGPAILAVDEDDTVWVSLARAGKLARYLNNHVELFDVGADSRPVGLAIGTAANHQPGVIWIAASFDNKLVRFDEASHQTREYPIPGEASWPFNIAIAADGMVWFSERAAGRIGRLDPATGEIRHYELPTPHCGPAGLAIDSLTGEVWFSASYADRIGRLDPKTGTVREYVMGESSTGLESGPAGLAWSAGSGIWFAKLEGRIGHIARGTEQIELFDVPREARRPAGIAIAADGDVWTLALDGNLLLRYQTARHRFVQYPLPSGLADARPGVPPFARTARPFGIGIDRQGNVWFSEQYTGQLGVLDVAPPTLEVFSPLGKVTGVEVPVTVRAEDRVAGIARQDLELDGTPVAAAHGRLDLAAVAPGPHRLRVMVVDGAGFGTAREVAFDFAPGPLAVQQLLDRLEPRAGEGEAAKAELLASARQLARGDVNANLLSLRQRLDAAAGMFVPTPLAALRRALDLQVARQAREVEVRILDGEPFFEPRQVRLRRGDSLLWSYNPPSDGHSMPARLHRIEIELAGTAVRSPLLRTGERFTFQFEHEGRFPVHDLESPGAETVVEVVAP